MPKKPARNAFYFFMKELEPSLRKEGRVFPNGMADVVPVAHPRWKELPPDEKERFENMAKEFKAKMRGAEGDKYKMDNVGNIIGNRVNKAEVNDKRRQKEKREVAAKWNGKDILDEKFYFINFQVLCRMESGDYLPCEIGVVEFSLSKGITKTFHRFIEPGAIPTGYRYVCMSNSEEKHQIPVENFEKADNNYTGMYIQLENFINPNGELPESPPLYCLSMDRELTEYCLEWIHCRSRMGHVSRVKKVYCLEDLLMDLYVHGNGPKISQTGCLDVLTSHHWDYSSNTRCDYHEELECKYCALAIVKRYAFAISDALAVVYNYKLTDKHIPSTAEEELPCVILPPSGMLNSSRKLINQPRNYSEGSEGRCLNSKRSNYQPSIADDDEDDFENNPEESMTTSLRRPNVACMAINGNVWNSHQPSQPFNTYKNTNDWPSISKDTTHVKDSYIEKKNGFTSSSMNSADIFGQTNIPLQNDNNSAKPQLSDFTLGKLPVRPSVAPAGLSDNQMLKMRGVQSVNGRMPTSLGMAGRGNSMLRGSVNPPVGRGYAPVGRGYAPVGRGYRPPNMAQLTQNTQNLSLAK